MFAVIQFVPEDGGTVSVINTKWLTPRRCEVYWPPIKGTKAFEKICNGNLTPDEKWKLYRVQRVFYETEDIEKAKKKLKLVEVTSDIQTQSEEENEKPLKRKQSRNRRYISSDEEDDDRYDRPPSKKKKFAQSFSINNHIHKEASLVEKDPSDAVFAEPDPDVNLRTPQKSPEQENIFSEFSLSNSVLQKNLSPFLNNGFSGQNRQSLTGFEDKVVSLLSFIKTQNELILSLLNKNTTGTETLKTEFKFPITDLHYLHETEKLLDIDEFKQNLISYLKTLGGRDLSYKTSRILKFVITNSVATEFNYFGKRSNKKPFSQLKLCAVVIGNAEQILIFLEAVKGSISGITTKDIEDAIKVWLKHAPEREKKSKARNMGETDTYT